MNLLILSSINLWTKLIKQQFAVLNSNFVMRNSYLQFEQSNVSWLNFLYAAFIVLTQESTLISDILKIESKMQSLTEKNRK
jgi:hypothetical protein